jgi:hypothetical protein
MITYFSVIRSMTSASDMEVWWKSNIKPEDQMKAANLLKIWLLQYPNIKRSFACGDWINGNGEVKLGYKVYGLNLTMTKQIELYNFFNCPVMTIKLYKFSDEQIIS